MRQTLGGEIESLRRSPLGSLPDDVLERLGANGAEAIEAGSTLVREGEPGTELFVIVAGTARVVSHDVVIGTLGAGDLAGELALLTEEPTRTATVVAEGELRVVRVPATSLDEALQGRPDVERGLRLAADLVVTARLLRSVGPLAGLSDDAARALAAKVEERAVAAGEAIVSRGDPSDHAFVLRSGAAKVERPGDAHDDSTATLTPGSLFGEVGLLAEEPRSATVRALENCRVLVLSRHDVMAAAESTPGFAERAIQLLRLRERPRRAHGIEAHDRRGEDGEPLTILKDPARGKYFRLSELGRFAWDRLDGTHNVRDLAIAYLDSTGRFAPQPIADVVAALAASGFVSVGQVRLPGVDVDQDGRSIWARSADRARRALTWRVDVGNVDERFGRMYRRLRFLYTKPGAAALVVVALAGALAFAWPLVGGAGWPGSGRPVLLWFLIPAVLLGFVVHEMGHALTVKAVGREVRRAGFGWFWLGPMAFVDVSDTWLSSRRERLGVALAGPAATALLAGLASLVALVAGPVLGGALWLYALSSYISIVQNLNPLIELDGYYIVVHWLDRPNLRSTSLAWLRDEGLGAVMHPSRIRGHGAQAAYALASVLYLVGSAALVVVLYRAVLEDWVARWLPSAVAAGIGWIAAIAVVTVTIAGIAGDLRAAGRARS